MPDSKFGLTVEDCIIIHLLDHSKVSDDFEAPFAVTQPGIADAISIRRSHVSYALKNTKEKGFVYDKIAHVKNKARKRKTYFLTQEGIVKGRKIRENIEKRSIEFVNESGRSNEIQIKDIKDHIPAQVILPLTKVIKIISTKGKLDLKYLQEFESVDEAELTDSKQAISGQVNFLDSMKKPTKFVGRGEEINKLQAWLEVDGPRTIVVIGIPGIGKTTLAAKIISGYSKKTNCSHFWYRLHEWDTIRGILSDISEFLSNLGKNTLKLYLDSQQTLDMHEIDKILEQALAGLDIIMVFDDFQKIDERPKQLFSMLTEILEKDEFKNFNLIILSRTQPQFYDRRDVAVRGRIVELELAGLDPVASKEIINNTNIDESDFEKIYSLTAGHPLTLELIGNHITLQTAIRGSKAEKSSINLDELFKTHHDITKYLREEIYHNLTEPERKLLEIVSVFRYPVPSDVFFVDDDIDYNCVDKLSSRSLLHESAAGYEMHELIKEFIYRRLTPKQKVLYHDNAAKHYSSELALDLINLDTGSFETTNSILESQYHYILSANHQEAAELAVEHGEGLINNGYTEEFKMILNQLNHREITDDTWAGLLIHKGHILSMSGSWDDALTCFHVSLDLSKKLKDNCSIAQALNAIGGIYYRKGDWNTAMVFYKEGLEHAGQVIDREEQEQNCSKLFSNIALVHWSTGELKSAIELIKKSMELSRKLGDSRGIARAYNNLGIFYWEQHKFEDAINAYNNSLELSEELGDKKTIAILYDNLGEAFRMMGELKKAEDLYLKSLKLSEKLRFKWQIAEVHCNLGILYKGSETTKSKNHLKTALELYEALGAAREVEKVKELLVEIKE